MDRNIVIRSQSQKGKKPEKKWTIEEAIAQFEQRVSLIPDSKVTVTNIRHRPGSLVADIERNFTGREGKDIVIRSRDVVYERGYMEYLQKHPGKNSDHTQQTSSKDEEGNQA